MLDLFCGRWGWSRAFAARGWECVGVDLVAPTERPDGCCFLQGDVLHFCSKKLLTMVYGQFDFICASPPCTEFSTINNFMPDRPYPADGVKLFNHTRELCEKSGLPYVIENVAGAMRFVGKADQHCGPFYLWGNAVPPLLPRGITKGLTMTAMGLREKKDAVGWNDRHGRIGRTPSALVATIPPELANCVADYAERLLEMKASA